MELSHLPEEPLVIVSQMSGLPWKIVFSSICAQLTCSSFKNNPLPAVVWSLTAMFTTALSTLAIVLHRMCMSAFQAEKYQRWPPALVRLSLCSLLLRSSFAAFPWNKDERTHRVPDAGAPSMGAWAKGPRKRSRPTLWSPFWTMEPKSFPFLFTNFEIH